jgi:limonene 1,2-monooxygenase
MLFFAATSGPRHEILSSNWRIAEEQATAHRQVMDRSALRLVAPFHIAPTRDQALSEVQAGHARWCTHMNEESEGLPARAGLDNLER